MTTAERPAELYIKPLFYDALSGEFRPPSDPQKQVQTLGRLGYTAFNEGELELINHSVEPQLDFRYTPSWAPNTVTTLHCSQVGEGGLLVAHTVSLTNTDSKKSLHIMDTRPGWMEIGHGDDEKALPLELGESLAAARLAVAEAAQMFFDEIDS